MSVKIAFKNEQSCKWMGLDLSDLSESGQCKEPVYDCIFNSRRFECKAALPCGAIPSVAQFLSQLGKCTAADRYSALVHR